MHSMTRELVSCLGKPARLIEADIATLKGEIKLSNPKLALKPVTIVFLLIKKEEISGVDITRYELLKRNRESRHENVCFFCFGYDFKV